MTPLEKREQLIRMFGAYSVRLEQIFDDYYNRLARIGLTEEVLPLLEDSSSLFSFSRVPEVRSQLDTVFDDFVRKQMGLYRTGIADGAILAIEHDSSLLSGYSILTESAIKTIRNNAVQGFLRGRLKSSRGLSLSQLVWNYASQAKSEFEVAISNVITEGLQAGTSAEELGQKVREQLNNPDMMYRRYHEKVVMSDGSTKDVAIWRRRVIDEDGRVRFVKEPLEKVGMGHYRSARKNALRLMRTEINASYHNANYERWQQEPFVIGIRIFLSPQHPEEDECDYLAGNYPKDFYWTGWHPACMCASAPITLQGDEKKDYYRRVALGEDMSGYVSPNAIRDVPDGYKEWIADNAERIRRADKRGKLAWHLEDNREYWEGIVNGGVVVSSNENGDTVALARAKFDAYDENWIKAYFNYENGGFNVYHRTHQFDEKVLKNKETDKTAKLTGGGAEKEVGRILADTKAKQIEFLPERGHKGKKADLSFDDETWDIKYIAIANQNTMRKAIEDGRKADNVIFFWDDEDRTQDLKVAVNRTVGKFVKSNKLYELPNIFYIKNDGELVNLFKRK